MIKNLVALNQFINKEALSGILLFVATVAAVIVANSSFGQEYYDLWHLPLGINIGDISVSMTLTYWIDDGLMALFFLMVGLEIKREMMIGELSSVAKASFPIVAAIGGMVIPALVYVAFNPDNPLGFGIPMATDIAFALGILMLLGTRVNPALKLFLVALAVVDDLGAVLVVATVYTSDIQSQYFLHAAIIYAVIWGLNIKGVTKLLPYLILGIALWVYIHAIGIHATIAGVLLAFAIPIKSKLDERKFIKESKKDLEDFEKHIDEIPMLNHDQIDSLENIGYNYDKVQNPLVRLEHQLHGLSAFFIMPLFAFSNAGVLIDFSTVNANLMIVLGVVFGLVVGKPIGIFGFTYLATKLNIVKKPENISWSEVLAVGFLGGIGFTMSIFITHLAFLDESIIAAVKLGVFAASFIAAVIGVILILRAKKA
ncbi:Na+/H+ antiporter NhaA [Poseidonibacter ostreae]|jgi:Na+:H+ antiporter, NhaA family|uniref:Na(+)/H(+) antiporter NhaA n=1 Tax=Poseidonibacter ostreae TaxID=2654171 RepID=A0A6L4WQT8_9BACT|nr:Na+/H+ antiporter NhaA [Poseidonibacter ostreae]KAB7885850.1 Na+/H+ antiporter NhaA [Poseidonibacter ostreae]KAB7886989.1 Na+/H+ antiporter NhaA [Poseidonibacter ostreae]KAB7889320.1 Na+/H+ antiporter NhaA [Poseidonibacter ostreae]MAC84618.1 Na+/H+ antiporter NhaA [Arcobacter sp.]|tara:strand:+ start:5231 stop:6511 length:1281 start_codon:yes stop_codon:yes gene_type:complete